MVGCAAQSWASSAEEEFAQAAQLNSIGAFEEALSHWKKAETLFEKEKNSSRQIETAIRLASTYYALGQTRLASSTLLEAQSLVSQKDREHLAEIKAGLGAIYTLAAPAMKEHSQHGQMADETDIAETMLKQSIELARAAGDRRVEAIARSNLGNLYSYREEHGNAVRQYKAANDLALAVHDNVLVSQACLNLTRSAAVSGDYGTAKTWAQRLVRNAAKLPDSHDKAYQLLGAGQVLDEIFLRAPDHDNDFRLQAFKAFQKAADVSKAIGDKRALSYALGYEARLYEDEKKFDEALTLTRKAVLLAQQLSSPDTLYRWQWQTGRLLRAKKENDAAIAAYRRAVETLQSIRHDVALRYGNPNAHSSFRDVAGAMYFQLADLLLQRADSAPNPAELEQDAARSTRCRRAAQIGRVGRLFSR